MKPGNSNGFSGMSSHSFLSFGPDSSMTAGPHGNGYGHHYADTFYGSGGNDSVSGGTDETSGNDFLYGGMNNDSLSGGAGNDYLFGGASNDSLFGGTGNDFLYGDAGNDFLSGGVGNDLLSGGAGADTYWFEGAWGNDTITYGSSNSQDTISFGSGITSSSLSAILSGDSLILTAANYGSITIQDWNDSQLNTLLFSDGTSQTLSSLLNGSTTSTTTTSGTTDKFALIVGVGDYPGTSSDLSGVSYDVKDMASFLSTDSVWSGTDIDVLKDTTATKTSLASTLETLDAEAGTGDVVLLYYSGHGYSDGGLVCSDYSEYSVSELYNSIVELGQKVGSSGHVTVVLDSCYSGALVDYFSSHTTDDRYTILTACSSSQTSYDIGTNGLFTSYLYKALTTSVADSNADSSITAQEVYSYLTSSAYASYDSVQLYGSGSYVLS